MIEVKFTEKDGTITLEVKGHAEAAESGQDIICSAASILGYTVAQIADNIYRRDGFEESPVIQLGHGNAMIQCKPKEVAADETRHTFFVAQVGYELLAHNYPQFVSLTKFGEA